MSIPHIAGATFSYAAVLPGLDPSVTWGVASAVKDRATGAALTTITAAIIRAADLPSGSGFSDAALAAMIANGDHVVTLQALHSDTVTWAPSAGQASRVLTIDVKFFNVAAPDPVLFTDTQQIIVTAGVTP